MDSKNIGGFFMSKINKKCLAIDPGKKGALVYLSETDFVYYEMPLTLTNDVCMKSVAKILKHHPGVHVVLERAMPFSMGMKSAFNYGRDFAALEIAIILCKNPVTYVEPRKWTKEMCQGIKQAMGQKTKNALAAQRLYPRYYEQIPKGPRSKKPHDGVVDALLMAGYGLRKVV